MIFKAAHMTSDLGLESGEVGRGPVSPRVTSNIIYLQV